MTKPTAPPNVKASALSLIFGGLLPIIAFTLIEEYHGPVWGTIAGMVFGVGEILYEKIRYKKVSTITWIGNALILGLGGISIISQDGIWFKLQPALFELGFAAVLIGSWVMKKPFLALMAEKQNPNLPEFAKKAMSGITFRVGLFFIFQAGLATWAAFYWSTSAWAFLKGVGVIIMFVLYFILEILWIRLKQRKALSQQSRPSTSHEP